MKILFLLSLIVAGVINTNESKTIDSEKIIEDKIVFEDANMHNSIDAQSTIESINPIMVKLNYSYERKLGDEYEDLTDEEIHEKLIEDGKRYHQKKNAELMKTLKFNGLSDVYVSKYAPYISFSESSSKIKNNNYSMLVDLAKNDNVEQIVVLNSKNQLTPNLTSAKSLINLTPTINAGALNGEGVTVGILEPTILNKNHNNFVNTDVKVRDLWYVNEKVSDHTTVMGSIIAGKDGIAPKAKLLSAQLSGGPADEIDWMLDNNVNVINCSYGDTNPNGIYSDKSAYMDYIVNTYMISIVVSAGNTGGYISNPGLGYNVITVGACSNTSLLPSTFSSHIVQDGPVKPNLSAPGDSMEITPFGYQQGTSVSAAVTTGCAALLMQKNPKFKLDPAYLRSILCANTSIPSSSPSFQGMNEYSGTGVLNFQRILDNYYDSIRYVILTETPRVCYIQLELNEGDTIRACLSWLAKVNKNSSSVNGITNFDLFLLGPDNQPVAGGGIVDDVFEFIQYTVPEEGYYFLYVPVIGRLCQGELVTLSFCIL